MKERPFSMNCPILERTADGAAVGRCWFYCPNGICPRHGDVSKELEHYTQTGELAEDPRAQRPLEAK